jgi:hypothetical protein
MRRSEFTYDIKPSSTSLTLSQTEREHNYSRRQPLTTGTKRRHQRKQQQRKRKQRHVLLSSSSDEY